MNKKYLNYASALIPVASAVCLGYAWENEQLKFLLGLTTLISSFASLSLIVKTIKGTK